MVQSLVLDRLCWVLCVVGEPMCVVETIGGWGDRVVGCLLRVMCDGGLVRAVLVMGDQGIRVDWVVLVNDGKYWDLGSVVSDV